METRKDIIDMINLYFGNVPNILSTILFLGFAVFFIWIMKRPDDGKKYKKAAIITVLTGTAMSALSGIKDSAADTMAVSFEQMNLPLAILCALGIAAVLLGISSAFCRKEKVNRVIFLSLSSIILIKTVVVEVVRIKEYWI